MTIEYRDSTVTNMDLDECKIAYKQMSVTDGSKLRYSVQALRNSPFKIATICLGLLCVLLVAGVIGQSIHYKNVEQVYQNNLTTLNTDKKNLQETLKSTQIEKRDINLRHTQLQQRYDDLSRTHDQTETNYNSLTEEVNSLKVTQRQLQDNNAALKKESDQLKASNTQLQTEKNTMTAAQGNLKAQYDSAVQRSKELQASYDSVTSDRNNLQNNINNVTRQKEQLQMSYNDLVKKVEHLQDRYNFSASEKDKIAKNHQNLTVEMEALKTTCDIIKTAENELQTSYTIAIKEKEELQRRLDNATAERDQLVEKVDRLNAMIQGKKCPAGWRKFENSCYFTSLSKKSWNLSREYCKGKGADLVIINNKEEMIFVNGLYSSDKEVWIGLTDGGVEGDWKWVDGTPMTLSFWAKGQPNSHQGRNQDCVEFWHRATGNGDWNDESCNVEQNYICEI